MKFKRNFWKSNGTVNRIFMLMLVCFLSINLLSQSSNPPFYIDYTNQSSITVVRYDKLELGLILPNWLTSRVDQYISEVEADPGNYDYESYDGLNPFDPLDLNVEAKFTHASSGQEFIVNGFYYKSFVYRDSSIPPNDILVDPASCVEACGISGRFPDLNPYPWRIRFAPTLAGNWYISINITHRDPKTGLVSTFANSFPNNTFYCNKKGNGKGFLKINDDGRYLEYTNPDISGADKSWFGVSREVSALGWCGIHYDYGIQATGASFGDEGIQRYWHKIRESLDHGANYIRVGLIRTSFGLENRHMGNYQNRQHAAWELDRMVEWADAENWHINLDIAHHYAVDEHTPWGAYKTQQQDCTAEGGDYDYYPLDDDRSDPTIWDINPYNSNGKLWGEPGYDYLLNGCIENAHEFWSDETAKRYMKNKLRYIVSRWGYSRSIAVWEIVNEVDLMNLDEYGLRDYYKDPQSDFKTEILSWTYEMADYIKSLDFNNRPTTFNLGIGNGKVPIYDDQFYDTDGDGEIDYEVDGYVEYNYDEFNYEDENGNEPIDMVTLHQYRNEVNHHDKINEICDDFDKPVMFNEVGFTGANIHYMYGIDELADIDNRIILWSSVFSGAFATHFPFWSRYDVVDHYEPIASFVEGENFNDIDFPPIGNDLLDHYNDFDNDMMGIACTSDYLNCKGLVYKDKTRLLGWIKHISANHWNVFHPPLNYDLVNDDTNYNATLPKDHYRNTAEVMCDDGNGGEYDGPCPEPEDLVINESITVNLLPNHQYSIKWYDTRSGDIIPLITPVETSGSNGDVSFVIPTINLARDNPGGLLADIIDVALADSPYDFAFKIQSEECPYVEAECTFIEEALDENIIEGSDTYGQIEIGSEGQLFYTDMIDGVSVCVETINGWESEEIDYSTPVAYEGSRLHFDGNDVYYRGENNKLIRLRLNGSNWEGSEIVNNSVDLMEYSGIATDGTERIFFINDDKKVCSYEFDSGAGSWSYAVLNNNAIIANKFSDLCYESGKLYYKNSFGTLTYLEDAPNWPAVTISNMPNGVADRTNIISIGDEHLFFIDASNRPTHVFTDNNGNWVNYAMDYSGPSARPGTQISFDNNSVYFINNDKLPSKYSWDYGLKDWVYEELIHCFVSEAAYGSDCEFLEGRMYYIKGTMDVASVELSAGCPKSHNSNDVSNENVLANDLIGTLTDNHRLSIFPNPSEGSFILTFESTSIDNADIRILDPMGRIANELKNQKISIGINNIQIDAKELLSGIYYLEVSLINEGVRMVERIVIE